MSEKHRRRLQWKQYETELEEARKLRKQTEELELSQKNALKVQNTFGEQDFTSAMRKLTNAAMLYDRTMPGCVQLTAFECESMPPHVFKEQLKLVFGIKLSPPELGALMAYFDKDGAGSIKCSDFVIQFLRSGIEERNRVQKEYRALLKRKERMLQLKEEERVKKEALRQMSEVDYEFTEAQFDSALRKLINMCHSFDGRTLGPAGWKAFESSSLNPSEFKEMMKRTFNIHLNSQELGALVTYFDVEMAGVVSCFHFLNCFVQMRVKIESFKGKQEEEENLTVYHSQLKEAYKGRIQRQMESDSNERNIRPWRSALTPLGNIGGFKAAGKRKVYPKSPNEKLKRRIYAGKVTGKMDLSSKSHWADSPVNLDTLATQVTSTEDEAVPAGPNDNLLTDFVNKNMSRSGIISTDWVDASRPTTGSKSARVPTVVQKIANNDMVKPMTAPKAFDIRLGSIPKEIFKISCKKFEQNIDLHNYSIFYTHRFARIVDVQ